MAGCRLRLEILARSRSRGLAVVVVNVSIRWLCIWRLWWVTDIGGAATGAKGYLKVDIRSSGRLIPRLHTTRCESNSGPLGGREGGTLGDLLRLSQRLQGASGLTWSEHRGLGGYGYVGRVGRLRLLLYGGRRGVTTSYVTVAVVRRKYRRLRAQQRIGIREDRWWFL